MDINIYVYIVPVLKFLLNSFTGFESNFETKVEKFYILIMFFLRYICYFYICYFYNAKILFNYTFKFLKFQLELLFRTVNSPFYLSFQSLF